MEQLQYLVVVGAKVWTDTIYGSLQVKADGSWRYKSDDQEVHHMLHGNTD